MSSVATMISTSCDRAVAASCADPASDRADRLAGGLPEDLRGLAERGHRPIEVGLLHGIEPAPSIKQWQVSLFQAQAPRLEQMLGNLARNAVATTCGRHVVCARKHE